MHAKAVAARGKVEAPVAEQFYGDRAGRVRDGNGNVWWIATHKQDLKPDEITRGMAAARDAQQQKKQQ